MKRITTILSLVLAVALVSVSCKDKASKKIVADNVESATSRDEAQKKIPVMSFEKAEHDFGTIAQGTPEYPKNTPIAPGESGELLVKFNGSGQNQVTKTITVTANTEKGTEMLRIKAFVNPAGAAPAGPVK